MRTVNGMVMSAVGAVIAVAILLIPIHAVEELETFFTSEPLAYKETFVRHSQVGGFCFPWFCNKTEVQYGLRNMDEAQGAFNVNFVFDNGSEVATKTVSTSVIAGEEVAITTKSPLKGESEVRINVLSPVKSVPHERKVIRRVSTLSRIPVWFRLR